MTRGGSGLHSGPLGPWLPRAGRPMLVRSRLLDRLGDRWCTRVTVVTAPAGYGKTTLLTQAIEANRSSPLGIDCWLACGVGSGAHPGRGSGAATVLGAGLCAAVETPPPMGPALGDSVDAAIGPVVAAVTEAVWRRSPDHVALIIDDVHEIPSGSGAARLLAALVDRLPANGHLVLAGRTPPPVPLARLELEGHVDRLDEADLAFTDGELAEFAALRRVPVSQLGANGGWPALAELRASARAASSGLTGDYLGEEVLAALDPIRRRHLALLTHLGPFDAELAGAALGTAVDVDELLAGIPLVSALGGGVEGMNGFGGVAGFDGVRALHPLWRSVLSAEVDPAEVAACRRRAARLLVGRGEPDKAVPLLIDAEAWDELGDALVIVLGAAQAFVPRDVLAEWYDRLPPEAQAGLHGQLVAAVRDMEIDPDGAGDRLEACAKSFQAAGDAAGEATCLAQLARLAWWSDEPERLAVLAVRVAVLASEGCHEAAALAGLGRALILDLQNDCRGMLAELDRVPPRSLNQTWQGVLSWLRSQAYFQLGHTEHALTAAEHALAHAGELHAPLAEGIRVQALWYGGRTAEALEAVPALLEQVEATGHRGHIAICAAQCSVAYTLAGDADRAAALLDQARAAAATPDAPLIDTNLSIAAAALAVLTGDEASARRTLADCLDRHPLRRGLSAGAHLRNLALLYVLVPETRAVWEQSELGPAFRDARDLARAVAALRDDRRLPDDTPPLPDTSIVQAHLPWPWLAELAVAAVDAGRDDGWRLLEDTWPAVRSAVVGLAEPADRSDRSDRADRVDRSGRADGDHLRGAAREVLGALPVPPTVRYRLQLLGPVELWRDGVLVDAPEWRRERVRAMLAHLVLHGTVSRDQLAEDLWPDRDPDVQSRNLRVALTYLLHVLEPDRGPRDVSFFVRQDGGNLTLHPGEWLDVDVWELDAVCQQAASADGRGAPAVALDRGLRAAEIWADPPSELTDEPWAAAGIGLWRRRFTAAVTRAGELLLAQGDTERALALAERALDADPGVEPAHRLVVAAHKADRDDLAARRAVGRYRDVVRELGVEADEAVRMAERLLASVPDRRRVADGPPGLAEPLRRR